MVEKSDLTSNLSYFAQYSPLVISRIEKRQTKLFAHQVEALESILDKASNDGLDPSGRTATSGAGYLLMGVGTGKSVIIECLPYVLGQYMTGRLAIVCVDNCTLRDRIMQDFPTLPITHVPIYESWPPTIPLAISFLLLTPKTTPPATPTMSCIG